MRHLARLFGNHIRPFLRAIVVALAGFIGIRKRQNARDDRAQTSALHIIIAGILMLAAFIALLLFIVNTVLN